MTQEKTTLEIIAPSVEEAVAKGLSQLGLSPEMVVVDVLDAGSRGLFGLGGRQARVRLSIKSTEPIAQPATPRKNVREKVPAARENLGETGAMAVEKKIQAPAEEDERLRVSRCTVTELLEKMQVKATVSANYIEAEQPGEEKQVLVDIEGDDLSILIGRRSETLNALQYISSLIVGKELGAWVPLLIDVQGYRQRREKQLRQLARRMADQALNTGKRQVLEPMPANERRLIHMELSEYTGVYTESQGEEPNRKVTILPRK